MPASVNPPPVSSIPSPADSSAETINEYGLYGSYDLAIHRFLRDVLTAVEPTLIVIQSSPMRAFADAAAMVAKGMVRPELLNADLNREALIPLPLISVTPSAPTKRENQRITPARNFYRTDLPGTDASQRQRWVARPPLPVWLNYQADLWTKTRSMMNALVTALQLKFDPYMAWWEVEIDNWFWGTVYMPIHLDAMTDNSELEGGDKDRLLRHTMTFRVEAWAFYPPERDFTVQKTTIDEMSPTAHFWALPAIRNRSQSVTHFEDLYPHPLTRFSSLYFQTSAHRLYQVALTAGGKINVIPTNQPPDPMTHYFGEKILLFSDGIILDQIPYYEEEGPSTQTRTWLLQYSGDLITNCVITRRAYTSLESLPPLVVGWEQPLCFGVVDAKETGPGPFLYGCVYLHRSLQLSCKPRYYSRYNEPPEAPPLPYQIPLPK